MAAHSAGDNFDCGNARYTAATVCAAYTDTTPCGNTWADHTGVAGLTFNGPSSVPDTDISQCVADCDTADSCFDSLSTFVNSAASNNTYVVGWVAYDSSRDRHTLSFAVTDSCGDTAEFTTTELAAACRQGYRSHHGTYDGGRRRDAALEAYNNRFVPLPASDDSGLSTGAIVGIVLGATAVVTAAALWATGSFKRTPPAVVSGNALF